MMFWRSRERSSRSIKKGNVSPETNYGKSNAAQSTSDKHMQSLKDGLKIFMSESGSGDFELPESSTKSNVTHATESSVKTAGFNDQTAATTSSTEDEEIQDPDEHLVIPEGITRLPFQPLPALIHLVQSIPSNLKSMNYYQRKASRFQPIISPPTSPMLTLGGRNSHASPNKHASHSGSIPPNLFTTFFGGSVSMSSPFTPKHVTPATSILALSPGRTGIAWADNLSPSAPSGVLNYYQNKNVLFEPVSTKSPIGEKNKLKSEKFKKARKLNSFQEENVSEREECSARNSSRTLPDCDEREEKEEREENENKEDIFALQYKHSPRTPFSSPLRQSTNNGGNGHIEGNGDGENGANMDNWGCDHIPAQSLYIRSTSPMMGCDHSLLSLAISCIEKESVEKKEY